MRGGYRQVGVVVVQVGACGADLAIVRAFEQGIEPWVATDRAIDDADRVMSEGWQLIR